MSEDLIRRSDVLAAATTEAVCDSDGEPDLAEVIWPDDVEDVPAVDAEEVVRCKDCTRWKMFSYNEAGSCSLLCKTTSSLDYCAWGNRREDNECD